ncbi:hypothetical protein Nepgr_016116 [Nepenthes gracilis]|uniref:AB hydrolase-1 domain-containing protein n=1 Tax=Nepenthes gracilis TaxID=150966 RepID=A0AAD3SP32_NEPGR|nr:hypothetical protein Nepgr_016116 [Nepenthes gracilis]
MAVGVGRGGWENLKRGLRTAFFMVAMVASLLVQCLPVLVAIGDVVVPCTLISSFTCVKCYGFRAHLRRYAFKSSLIDIPVVSVIRSLIITCVYSLCDGPALSHGPYLGSVILCSISSILLLSIKACLFSANYHINAEASHSSSRQRLYIKKSWGMPVLFLSSAVFALGHMVIAYRTSCRARRKLLFHRVDPEAVLYCKSLLSTYQKAPRSPIPSIKIPKSVGEARRKPFGLIRDEDALPVRSFADIDSLFITCWGFTLHYKLSLPSSSPHSLSLNTFIGCNNSCSSPPGTGRLKSILSKTPCHLRRSFSNQFHSSLYDPLFDSTASLAVLPDEIPFLNLADAAENDELRDLNPFKPDANSQSGVVLVHGFGGGVFSWRHVLGTLASEIGCPVAAFDRPGWGLTPRPQRKDWEEKELPNPYKLETQVDLLLLFCFEMGFSSVILVGHDDGGLLVLKAAERAQTNGSYTNVTIKAVVLISLALSREVVPAFARLLLRTSLGKKHAVHPLLRTEITQVVNRRAWYDATKLTAEVLSLYKVPLCVEGWDEALQEIGKLSCETVLSPQNAASLLKSVEHLPVLVITGAEDALVSLKSSRVLASKLLNSRLVAISGCGHLPHEECPKALLAAMIPFISRTL